MTSTCEPISRAKAEAVLAALTTQFAKYLAPVDLGDGRQMPGAEPPRLVERVDGTPHWGIEWADGPDNWVDIAFSGGVDDTSYQLLRDIGFAPAKAESGSAVAGVKVPTGVQVDAIRYGVLGLYPS
jgi:hypothetical protein